MTDITSIEDISRRFDLTPTRAQQLAAAGIFVKATRGRYLLCESAINYALFLKRSAGSEAGLPATISEIAHCAGESVGNARTLAKSGMFKKISRGRYDLIESVRSYIKANKAGWRDRGRQKRCSCGAPMLPLGPTAHEVGNGPSQ